MALAPFWMGWWSNASRLSPWLSSTMARKHRSEAIAKMMQDFRLASVVLLPFGGGEDFLTFGEDG